MSWTTLATVSEPTLLEALPQLLRIGDALQLADGEVGVTVYADDTGHVLEAEPDGELPGGVLEYVQRIPVEPFTDWQTVTDATMAERAARLELLELLAHVTAADVLATAETVELL